VRFAIPGIRSRLLARVQIPTHEDAGHDLPSQNVS